MYKFPLLFLRLRYLLPASAVGGYYQINRKYEDIKASLPEMPEFVKNIDLHKWAGTLDESKQTLRNWMAEANNSIASEITRRNEEHVTKRNETLISKAGGILKTTTSDLNQSDTTSPTGKKLELKSSATTTPEKSTKNSNDILLANEVLNEKRNEELLSIRKELERLRRENRELRSASRGSSPTANRKLKKSLIEIYSEVLDELSVYDSTYKALDHLPKVVVVGDQSSGKTSVLEMIAGARIFPRGAGEMMTRAPVQVTLCEGPYHIARFKDSAREYDLTKEAELAELRSEIELRMRQSVQGGKTVSNQVISLTIQGPGIQRMVLVDLPGIIGTVTTELAPDTKECIKKMVTEYMGNPNAIILCIQDGSLDAERSIFTDLVREIDKKGKRTILVLTKVDIAEKTHTNPGKIKKILDGELFPMKALGYYAVVAGKSGKNENIQEIKDYEEQFFLTSSLCEKGILNPSQCTTRNLSAKVSECFWGMVKASIEQQADTYRATLFNLEAEWNRLFPHRRQLTRNELFFNARNELLDEVARLSRLSTKHWDQYISTQLWQRVNSHIMSRIYFPASVDPINFGTKVDIELQRWVESHELPKLAIKVAQDSVKHQFDSLLNGDIVLAEANKNSQAKSRGNNKASQDSDDSNVYQDLKRAVIHGALERHQWKSQALEVLRVVQLEALSKQMTLTRDNWKNSIDFLQDSLKGLIEQTSDQLTAMTGHSFSQRWLKWKSLTQEQRVNQTIQMEFEKLIASHDFASGRNVGSGAHLDGALPLAHAHLSETELAAVQKNLEAQGMEATREAIQQFWMPYYKHKFLTNEVSRAQECRKLFYFYENDIDSGTDCSHVLFFWRIRRMLEFTANSLRRQILEDECRRIEKEIIEVLEEFSEDEGKKVELLSGKRVELAEELRRVRQIQEKLDEFITALNQEA